MSELVKTKIKIKSSNIGKRSSLPDIKQTIDDGISTEEFMMDEDDGLFAWYGEHPGAFPYIPQDMYDRDTGEKDTDAVILENAKLKATFLPGFGGKLWSLYDKINGKELLYTNDIIRPCNLALRNAWTAGGVEWNCGWRGHHPYTCEYIHTAETKLDDGTPVLRFYWYERVRGAVVQMDCFLPDESDFLFTRTRITNPKKEVIPMYWWSNIAAVQKEGDRAVVPADESYSMEDGNVVKFGIPEYKGIDVTYPLNNIIAKDFFWKNFKNSRRYIAQLDKNGYGLCETSTKLLKGRKLFVWGNSQGGSRWMNYLTSDDRDGHYDEIQCGLAASQYECLPMPPHTVWEWAEAYGPLITDPKEIHGNWENARAEVERKLEDKLGEEYLENLLRDTENMAKSPAGKILFRGDGWGALELLRREKAGIKTGLMNPHLDFGETDEEQNVWVSLIENGTSGEKDPLEVPASYVDGKEWLDILKNALKGKDGENWYTFYQLGCSELYNNDHEKAEELLKKSVGLRENPWAFYALCVCSDKKGDAEAAADYIMKAHKMVPENISVAKETMYLLYKNGKADESIEFFENAPENVKNNKRCMLFLAFALARKNRTEEAEKILCGEDGKTYLNVPDIREGEETVTDLWFLIQEKKGFDRKSCGNPPAELDFRMFARAEEMDK